MLSHSNDAYTFRQLLPHGQHFGSANPPVSTCTDTVRRVVAGDVFFACVDGEYDGHDDLEEAVRLGAIAVVAERYVVCDVPLIVVDDCREAFAIACHRLLGTPSEAIRTTAVAGTDGKTTVAALLESVLNEAGNQVTSRTSLGISAPAGYAQKHTNPSAAELAGWLAQAVHWGADDAILEVDSRDAATRRSEGASFDHLILTGASAANLDLHRTKDNYQRALWGLTSQLKPGGALIANYDDPVLRRQLADFEVPTLTYSLHEPTADLHATLLERHRSEQTFMLEAGHHVAMVRTKIIGDQHIRNCLAATAVGMLQGMSLPQIAKGLERIERLKGRLDRVECGQPFGVFIEQHATTSRLAAALATLKSVTSGKLWCVFGGNATTDDHRLAAMGGIIERYADRCVLTGPDHQHRSTWPLVHDVMDGMNRPGAARVIPTRERAIRWSLDEAGSDDVILIVGGASDECPLQAVGQQDDRQLVESHLRAAEDDAPMILPFPSVGPA